MLLLALFLVLEPVLGSALLLILCFKQKTAYVMRISDWSSDVCSADLDSAGMDFGLHHTPGSPASPGRGASLDAKVHPSRIAPDGAAGAAAQPAWQRSEERRVGKEWVSACRARWAAER